MSEELNGKRIAFLTANEGVEQVELTDPRTAVEAAGATTTLISLEQGDVQCFNHLTRADVFEATVATADADVADYDALVLPGGVANPDQLRMDHTAVAFVKSFVDAGKPIGVICHGGWTLVEADVVGGRTMTSWPSLSTDIENAGGNWVDQEVSVCESGPNIIVSSRNPDDLPAFNEKLVEVFAR